jgi:uncharacterized OB-fold protein
MNEPYLKPLPQKQPENAPLWEGLAQREFRVPKCDDCGAWNWVPYPACRECLSENLTWTKVSGNGTLFTYTIVHRGLGAFHKDVPYVVGLVEMELPPGGKRGVIVLGNVVGVPHDELRVGMPLKMTFKDIEGEDVTLWEFTKRED